MTAACEDFLKSRICPETFHAQKKPGYSGRINLINNHSGDLGDQSTQLFFRMEAEDLINGLTILEGNQRRD